MITTEKRQNVYFEKETDVYELRPTYNPFFGLDNYEILINRIIGNPKFEKFLKEVMEKQIYSYWINNTFGNAQTEDNPFDSIYIADLSPDKIGKADLQLILLLADKIEDRSHLISFNDELGD